MLEKLKRMFGKGEEDKNIRIYKTDQNLENRKVRIFWNSRQGYGGNKKECQDTTSVIEGLEQALDYFAVYDGHGPTAGKDASEMANQYVEDYLRKNRRKLHDLRGSHKKIEHFLKKCYNEAQKVMKKQKTFDFSSSGTCACAVLVHGQYLYSINVGDSRAVLCYQEEDGYTEARELTWDHKPDRPDESQRINDSNGEVAQKESTSARNYGPMRVWSKKDPDVPGLAISRSLGDLLLHEVGVIATPEINVIELEKNDKFIIIASDGLWDVMSSAEAVGFICQAVTKPEQAARLIVEEARNRWDWINRQQPDKLSEHELALYGGCDDISAVVCFFTFT